MQCSSRKFIASQVYYGLRIAYPKMAAEELTDRVVREADMLIDKLDKRRSPRKPK